MSQTSPAESLEAAPGTYHMGDLARGGAEWKVYLETNTACLPVKGRVHFVSAAARRATGWVFIEQSESDLLARFQQFSALELWRLLESLA